MATIQIPADVIERVKRYKAENGRAWKSKLRSEWTRGTDSGLLRQARNYIGPSRLDGMDKAGMFA